MQPRRSQRGAARGGRAWDMARTPGSMRSAPPHRNLDTAGCTCARAQRFVSAPAGAPDSPLRRVRATQCRPTARRRSAGRVATGRGGAGGRASRKGSASGTPQSAITVGKSRPRPSSTATGSVLAKKTCAPPVRASHAALWARAAGMDGAGRCAGTNLCLGAAPRELLLPDVRFVRDQRVGVQPRGEICTAQSRRHA
jgi:hypothetical protein